MFATRLLLISTFASGCISGALLIGFWRHEPEIAASPTRQAVARTAEPIATPIATAAPVPEPALIDDAREVHTNTVRSVVEVHTDTGSSVAEVLVRLEAAYRQGLAAPTPADPSVVTASARADAEPVESPTAVTATAETIVVLAAAAPPPAAQAAARPAEPEPVASRDEAPPRTVNVHVGDNVENTHVGDVFEGDVVVVQQVAVPAYLPFFAPGRHARGGFSASAPYAPRGMTSRQAPTFASSWTVPNDRLGYDSALVPKLK